MANVQSLLDRSALGLPHRQSPPRGVRVRGVCLSSYLLSGSQPSCLSAAGPPPVCGQSLGEPCLDWRQTQEAVRMLAKAISEGKPAREAAGGDAQERKRPRG